METAKNILIAPLDWGLGHATRCVPIINKLINLGANVIIAADKRPFDFLIKEFPDLKSIRLPGYDITYSKGNNLSGKIIKSFPRIRKRIKLEHKALEKIIEEHKIDVVISDNRYGLWNYKIKTVFITHQLNIKAPRKLKLFESVPRLFIRKFIRKYDECWVPDYEGKINLSGDLSHKAKLSSNVHFIGPLSRFHLEETDDKCFETIDHKHDLLVILSGPEPQRTMFENIISEQLKTSDLNTVVIRGITEKFEESQLNMNVKIFTHLKSDEICQLISKSKIVLCRPGYSSIMDLTALGKDAIFVPTPGQTEQEYLAKHFMAQKVFFSMKQKDFNLELAIEQSANYNGVKLNYNPSILDERIETLLKN